MGASVVNFGMIDRIELSGFHVTRFDHREYPICVAFSLPTNASCV